MRTRVHRTPLLLLSHRGTHPPEQRGRARRNKKARLTIFSANDEPPPLWQQRTLFAHSVRRLSRELRSVYKRDAHQWTREGDTDYAKIQIYKIERSLSYSRI